MGTLACHRGMPTQHAQFVHSVRSTGLCEAQVTNCEGAFGVGASDPPFGRRVLLNSPQVDPIDKCTSLRGGFVLSGERAILGAIGRLGLPMACVEELEGVAR